MISLILYLEGKLNYLQMTQICLSAKTMNELESKANYFLLNLDNAIHVLRS